MNFVKIEKDKKNIFIKENLTKIKLKTLLLKKQVFEKISKLKIYKIYKNNLVYLIISFLVLIFLSIILSYHYNIYIVNKNFFHNTIENYSSQSFFYKAITNSNIQQTKEENILENVVKKIDVFNNEKFLINKKLFDINVDIKLEDLYRNFSKISVDLLKSNFQKKDLQYVLKNENSKDYIEIEVVKYTNFYEIKFFAFIQNENIGKEDIKRIGSFLINKEKFEEDKSMIEFMKDNSDSIKKLLYIINLHLNSMIEENILQEKNSKNKINGILN